MKHAPAFPQGDWRVGFGYDVHPFGSRRRLVLGGVRIPHPLGLEGHSDADVLLHALMDALLGAAGLGDIGEHFPNTEARYQGISSLILLKRVKGLLDKAKTTVIHVDLTLMAEVPKVAPYKGAMRKNIAQALRLPLERVSLKATTQEGLGFVGRQEGMAAVALATVLKHVPRSP